LEGLEPDPIFNARTIREFYERANDQNGKYTVPILWDKKLHTVVSNESSEIIRMLNSEFNDFAKYPDLDLYPEDLRTNIDDANDWIYPTINNGVYRCGFAKSQEAYDIAIGELTESFDRIDQILQKQRYIVGNRFTEADVRLFVTLLRFDEVYAVYFKTNTRNVTHTPSILNYCREIYQMSGVADTVNMKQIKMHYYTSHPDLNRWSIIPRGNNFEERLKEPHNRQEVA
jgi:putative glutathione S-transferase